MLDEDVSAGIEVENFDLPTRKRQLFAMFGGRTELVEIRADKSLVDVIYDKFGDRIKLSKISGGQIGFSAEVQVSPTFLAWCCSLGDKLKVISPPSVVQEVKGYLDGVCKLYQD